MHDALFADAARPERVSVLNLLMLDYSIGHELLLWQQRNPLAVLSRDGLAALDEHEQREAVMNAALACSRPWHGLPKTKAELAAWGRQTRRLKTEAEVDKFRAYRAAGSQTLPTRDIPKTGGAPFHYFGSPEAAMLLLFVQPLYQDFGYATPFDFPLGLARTLYLTDAETKGNVWVKNFHDLKDEERVAAFEKSNPESTLAVGEDAVQAAAEKWNREHPESLVPLMKPETRNPKPEGRM
ncbi:MAG: hypothetical protein ABFD89_06625 [Bryobacteraceae bacterium]